MRSSGGFPVLFNVSFGDALVGKAWLRELPKSASGVSWSIHLKEAIDH